MIPPEDFLDSQVCTECHRYLSVFPIKVYHNKSVKCGRCSSEDDDGVESHLTQMILQNIKFPCNNALSGCKKWARPYEMKNHLKECLERRYDCLICKNFTGIPLQLLRHCERKHRDKKLRIPSIIDPQIEKNTQKVYFYRQQGAFCFVTVAYTFSKLYVKLANCCHLDERQIWMEVTADETKTEKLALYRKNPGLAESYCWFLEVFSFSEEVDPKTLVINFRFIEKPCIDLTSLTGPLILYKPKNTVKYTFRHTFTNIWAMEMDKDYYLPMAASILDHTLRVSAYIRDQMFQVYLEWGSSNTKSSTYCKAFAICSVSSKLGFKTEQSSNAPLKVGTFLGLLEINRDELVKEEEPNEVHVKVLVRLLLNPKIERKRGKVSG